MREKKPQRQFTYLNRFLKKSAKKSLTKEQLFKKFTEKLKNPRTRWAKEIVRYCDTQGQEVNAYLITEYEKVRPQQASSLLDELNQLHAQITPELKRCHSPGHSTSVAVGGCAAKRASDEATLAIADIDPYKVSGDIISFEKLEQIGGLMLSQGMSSTAAASHVHSTSPSLFGTSPIAFGSASSPIFQGSIFGQDPIELLLVEDGVQDPSADISASDLFSDSGVFDGPLPQPPTEPALASNEFSLFNGDLGEMSEATLASLKKEVRQHTAHSSLMAEMLKYAK